MATDEAALSYKLKSERRFRDDTSQKHVAQYK